MRASDSSAALLCAAVAAALLLPDLGDGMLWQDEAQTALLAESALERGVPFGFDGRNHFSQELGKEYAPNTLWRWHTWLSFYATAASFALFGKSAFAARLPFALAGIATAALCYAVARRLWRDRAAALAAGLACALSVPFLIFSRQCRYHTLAAFCCLAGLGAYAQLERSGARSRIALFAAALGAFHTHYVYAATLWAGIGLHALLFARARLRPLLGLSAALVAALLPWLLWFAPVRPGGDAYAASVLDPGKLAGFALDYTRLAFEHFLPPWLLLAPLLVAGLRARRVEPPFAVSAATRDGVALVACYAVASILLLSALSPLLFYRYLAPVAPALFLLQGLLFGRLYRASRVAAALAAALWLGGSQLDRVAVGMRHDFEGPIEGITALLAERARPGDLVAISYEDLPLKFHTPYRVIGGLTGEDLSDAARADWIILRHHTNTRADAEVKRVLEGVLRANPGGFVRHRLTVADTPFENREVPGLHRFRSAAERLPRLIVWERRR
jgi:4-amino-4-deoxy-L-arabinose transferase-like glycosyltransferase